MSSWFSQVWPFCTKNINFLKSQIFENVDSQQNDNNDLIVIRLEISFITYLQVQIVKNAI